MLGDQSGVDDQGFRSCNTSVRQDTKRAALYNRPKPFNVNATMGQSIVGHVSNEQSIMTESTNILHNERGFHSDIVGRFKEQIQSGPNQIASDKETTHIDVIESDLGPSCKRTRSAGTRRITDETIETGDGIEPAESCVFGHEDIQEFLVESPIYVDLGDCDEVCEHCKAIFWHEERLKTYFKDRKARYHRCCKGGKVMLPIEPDPPEYIKNLFKNRLFLDNIRAYNQMFSMTSFGAHVDESINDGKGPYVFKVSGQIYHWIGKLCPTEGDPPRFLQLYI